MITVFTITLVVLIVSAAVLYIWREAAVPRRRARAIKNARWESYQDLTREGTVEIGIRRVARWDDDNEEIVQTVTPVYVKAEDLEAIDMALQEADIKVPTYNAFLRPVRR